MSFRKFDRAAVPVRHFSSTDIAGFEMSSAFEQIFNDLIVYGRDKDGKAMKFHRASNDASKDAFGYINTAGLLEPQTYSGSLPEGGGAAHSWLNSVARVSAADYPSGFSDIETNLRITYPRYRGFSGTLITDAAGVEILPPGTRTQQPEHQLSAARPAYFLITNHQGDVEIVRSEAFTFPTGDYGPIDSPLGSRMYWMFGDYTIIRAQHGTTAIDWTPSLTAGAGFVNLMFVYDITIAVWWASTLLDRAAYGIPRCTFNVQSRHADLELGDPISFDESVFLTFGESGADSGTIWEVIGLAPVHDQEDPGFRVTCARIRSNAVVPPETVTIFPPEEAVSSGFDYYIDAFGNPYVDAFGEGYIGPA